MTLAQLRLHALGRFGLHGWEGEHGVLNWPVTRRAINDAHRWFAARTLCYYDANRSESVSAGTARYALDSDVIRVDPATLRISVSGSYTQLVPRLRSSLLVQYGALEGVAGGTPQYVVLEAGGETNDETAVVQLVPTPNATATLYYGGWIYPAELAETDRPLLPEAEQARLLTAICWRFAELLEGAGQESGAADWLAKAEREAEEFYLLLHGGGGSAHTRTSGRSAPAPARGKGR